MKRKILNWLFNKIVKRIFSEHIWLAHVSYLSRDIKLDESKYDITDLRGRFVIDLSNLQRWETPAGEFENLKRAVVFDMLKNVEPYIEIETVLDENQIRSETNLRLFVAKKRQ